MFNQKKLWVVVIIVAILASVFVVWKYTRGNNGVVQFDPNIDVGTLSGEQQQEYWKNLAELYKKDTYGGKTPEETLQLFIDALKKGDTDLAAKYFVPEKQKKEAEDLKLGKKNNVLYLTIADLEKTKIGSEISDGKYRFTTYDDNKNAEFQFDLVLNKTNSIWKITNL